jgi:hypothetical protein
MQVPPSSLSIGVLTMPTQDAGRHRLDLSMPIPRLLCRLDIMRPGGKSTSTILDSMSTLLPGDCNLATIRVAKMPGLTLRFRWSALVLCLTVAVFVAKSSWRTELEPNGTTELQASDRRPDQGEGVIRVVFVGSSRCAGSNYRDIPKALSSITGGLSKLVRGSTGGRIEVVGISDDGNVSDGVRYLKKTYAFDSIVVGSLADGATSMYLSTLTGYTDRSVPQLFIVHERFGAFDGSPRMELPLSDSTFSQVRRYIGVLEIAKLGALLLQETGELGLNAAK